MYDYSVGYFEYALGIIFCVSVFGYTIYQARQERKQEQKAQKLIVWHELRK